MKKTEFARDDDRESPLTVDKTSEPLRFSKLAEYFMAIACYALILFLCWLFFQDLFVEP